jgi:hypothetical protein
VPRPRPPRSLANERNVAARVAYERERLEMSYAGLATRMTDLGCTIDAAAIYKIEKNDPPRRITVDELVTFAEVFGVSVMDMLVPPADVVGTEVASLLDRFQAIGDEIRRLDRERNNLRIRIGTLLVKPRTARLVTASGVWPAIRDVVFEGRPDLQQLFTDHINDAVKQQEGRRGGQRRKKT